MDIQFSGQFVQSFYGQQCAFRQLTYDFQHLSELAPNHSTMCKQLIKFTNVDYWLAIQYLKCIPSRLYPPSI